MVPRILSMIDNVTNWYIRFNRKRLKGEFGVEDTLHALNSLFEVLYTIVRGMAPFAPFLTDNIYQRLLPYIPKSMLPEDARSVHFLSYPEERHELYDPDIERRVSRMQKVIDLTRVCRERKTIGLKTPLKTLIVLHQDPQYLEDVKSLESYILEELNMRELVVSSEEDKYGVVYTLTADWPVLGKKLKKDVQRVKKALPAVSSADCKKYIADHTITVDGIELGEGDLVVSRGIDPKNELCKTHEPGTDQDVLILVDTELYPELQAEGVAREIVNRIQRQRKKAGLVATDDVRMVYDVTKDSPDVKLEEVFTSMNEYMEKILRRPVEKDSGEKVVEGHVLLVEEQEVHGATFLLKLLKL